MSYILSWKNPAVDPGKTSITVPVASVVSNASSLTLTGKGAASYGQLQQTNLLRLLENFADTTAPSYATVGQVWYNSASKLLNVCTSTAPLNWKTIGGVQFSSTAPVSPNIGDLWFQQTGPLSGYLYIFTGLGRYPLAVTTNGGWEQLFPRVDAAALRFEYNQIFSMVDNLIGNATGAAGAFGSLFTYLPNFSALDADLNGKFNASPDGEIYADPNAPGLDAQVVSRDWDTLLYTGRWAIARLDIPASMLDDVSGIPFVQDGHQVAPELMSYPANDPRFPIYERRTHKPVGLVTAARLYTETYNALSTALANRYSLRGIAGASGVYTSFGPDVVSNIHCRRSGSFGGGVTATVSTTFTFASQAVRDRFVFGGNAIDLALSYTGGLTLQDTAWTSFLSNYSRIRVTADKVRFFSNTLPLTLKDGPTTGGFIQAIAGTPTLATRTVGTSTMTVSATVTATTLTLVLQLYSDPGLTGTTGVDTSIIRDRTAFGPASTPVWPGPQVYNSATDAGTTSSFMGNIAITTPPVASFSANATTGSTSTPFTFTWTGTGATLVEWDFDGSGVFTTTGNSAIHTYSTAGRYTVRVRGTNAGGQDVLAKTSYITIT